MPITCLCIGSIVRGGESTRRWNSSQRFYRLACRRIKQITLAATFWHSGRHIRHGHMKSVAATNMAVQYHSSVMTSQHGFGVQRSVCYAICIVIICGSTSRDHLDDRCLGQSQRGYWVWEDVVLFVPCLRGAGRCSECIGCVQTSNYISKCFRRA